MYHHTLNLVSQESPKGPSCMLFFENSFGPLTRPPPEEMRLPTEHYQSSLTEPVIDLSLTILSPQACQLLSSRACTIQLCQSSCHWLGPCRHSVRAVMLQPRPCTVGWGCTAAAADPGSFGWARDSWAPAWPVQLRRCG